VFAALLFAALVVVTLPAGATQLTVSSYSMYDGATGSFDYRDFRYVPCNGVCDVTSAYLRCGTGKLTDGVSPALSWYQYGRTPYGSGGRRGLQITPTRPSHLISPLGNHQFRGRVGG
jgi:hypothetical protein